MIGERRRPVLERALVARVALVWAAIAVLLLLTGSPAILSRSFVEGDDIMRLLQVRDWLGLYGASGQGWFDTTQYRIDAPFGAVMHWSRIVDLPLAAVILLLSPVLGPALAEHVAAVVVPLVTLFGVLLLIGRISWRLFDEEATGLACLVAAMAMPLLHQLRPMRIDHHGWQIALALLAVNALMARNARIGGWVAGAALAAWLAISLEAIPMIAAICGLALFRWMRCWTEREWLVSILQSLAVTSLGLYLLTQGLPWGPSQCDIVSPAHLVVLGVVAMGATGLGLAPAPRPMPFVILVLGSSALAGIVAMLQIAPQCAGGSFAGLDPVARSVWLANVTESRPLWHQDPAVALQILLPPLIGLYVCLRLAAASGDWLHRWHLEFAFLIAASLMVAIFLPRAGPIPAALAAVPLGWQLKQWLRALRHLHRPTRQAMAAAGIMTALLPAMPLTLLMYATPGLAGHPAAPAQPVNACMLREALPALGDQKADILAPIDLGPAILLDSPHRVVATAHHRAGKGIGDTIRAFTGSTADAHAMLLSRGIEYVVICPSMNEIALYRQLGEGDFADRLVEGDTPDWLMPIEHESGPGVLIWRVIG